MVKGEGSHYCHSKLGLHASSAILFNIDYEGNIYQGCWCKKTNRGGVCCKITTKGMSGFNETFICIPWLIRIFTTR